MYNVTDDLMIILSGEELSDAIHLAFDDTFRVLQGSEKINPSTITSRTNSHLAIYKFYCKHNFHSGLFTESWLLDVFKISDEPQDSITLKNYEKFIPYLPESTHSDFTKTYLKKIKSGLRVFFYALYARKAILLPTNYAFPKSWKNNTWVENAIDIYPELLAIFRNCFINKSKDIPDISAYLPEESNTFCRDYAYKIFIATTWYEIEDISLEEAIQFSKALYEKKIKDSAYSSPHYSLPLNHVLTTLYRFSPKRCNFDIENIGFLLNTNRSLTTDNIEDLNKYEENKKAAIWLGLQKQYLKYRSKRYSTWNKDKKALGLLNRYLFVDLIQVAGEDAIPSTPKDFDRIYIDGNIEFGGNIPSLIDTVEGSNKSTSNYNNLKKIEVFFKWLEQLKGNEYAKGFTNPISKFDYPLTSRPKGTNKKIFPSRSFVVIHSLVHALCDFFYYLVNSGKYSRKVSTRFSYYDTEELGFVPIYYDSERQIIPIKAIPSRLLTNETSKRNGKLFDYPCFQGLFLIAVALETGLRHIHIRWLDRDTFDKHLDADFENCEFLGELTLESAFIEVSTDKVKQTAWRPFVSARAIKLLMRLKEFQDSLDIDVPALFYDDNESTHYKKIRSLFHPASIETNKPFSYDRTVTLYRNIQLFFDLQVLMQKLKADTLNPVPAKMKNAFNAYQKGVSDLTVSDVEEFKKQETLGTLEKAFIKDAFSFANHYESDYTPHGTRSSVISEKIKVLPPWVIAEFISGHESLAVLHHYVQLDKEDVRDILESQSRHLSGDKSILLDNPNDFTKRNAAELNEKLKQVVDADPNLVIQMFGGFSFSESSGQNEIKSGVNLLRKTPTSNFAFMSTHICPFNGQCPQDVINDFGKNKCGPCYYSVKTIDHIPRILAEARKLYRDVKNYETQISLLNSEESRDESSIDKLDREKREVAFELAAWVHTYKILKIKREELKKNKSEGSLDAYIVPKPFMLHDDFIAIQENQSEAAEFLLRMQDADMFKEYFTPSLKAEILNIRNKILINQQKFDQLISNTDVFSLTDELRGLIRDVAEKEGVSPIKVIEDLRTPLNELKINNIALLEVSNG